MLQMHVLVVFINSDLDFISVDNLSVLRLIETH